MSNTDCKILVALIDLENCIRNNDMEIASRVCDTLNSLELTVSDINFVNDKLNQDFLNGGHDGYDVYVYMLDNLKWTENVEDKRRILNATLLFNEKNVEKINAWIDANINDELSFDMGEGHLHYARLLIGLCSMAKRYDKMDELRSKIVAEVN